MKLALIAAAALALVGPFVLAAALGTQAASAATAPVTISNVVIDGSLITLDVYPPDGSSWDVRQGNPCTYQVTYLDGSGHTQAFDGVGVQYSTDYTSERLQAPGTVSSVLSIVATCTVSAQSTYTATVTVNHTGTGYDLGTRWSARSTSAYSRGGNCNWGRHSGGTLLSTCLSAHAKISYRLVLPKGTTYTGISHSVSSGAVACRNTSWTTTHKGRTYTTTFRHGSRAGFSQCEINRVALHYKWKTYVTQTRTLTTYATATGSIPVAPTDAVATISNVTYESNFNLTTFTVTYPVGYIGAGMCGEGVSSNPLYPTGVTVDGVAVTTNWTGLVYQINGAVSAGHTIGVSCLTESYPDGGDMAFATLVGTWVAPPGTPGAGTPPAATISNVTYDSNLDLTTFTVTYPPGYNGDGMCGEGVSSNPLYPTGVTVDGVAVTTNWTGAAYQISGAVTSGHTIGVSCLTESYPDGAMMFASLVGTWVAP